MTTRLTNRAKRFAAALLIVAGASGAALGQDLPQKHALLFGINRYQAEIAGVPRLRFAKADASDLEAILEARGWDARVFVDEEVTRNLIITELTRLAFEARQQDSVLIFFAGHGVRHQTGLRHTYWLTYRASLTNLAVEGIRLSHLFDYINDIRADRKIVLLDHCNSGDVQRLGSSGPGGARDATGAPVLAPASGEARNLFPVDEVPSTDTDQPGGLVILGSAQDAAYEFESIEHGLFTHGLLQALQDPEADSSEDGRLSLTELWTYAQAEMNRVKQGVAGIVQTPVEVLRGSNLMSWDLIDAAAAAGMSGDELLGFLSQLEQETDLDTAAQAVCFMAVRSWEQAERDGLDASPNDAELVQKIKELSELGSSIPWDVKKELLQLKLVQLGLREE